MIYLSTIFGTIFQAWYVALGYDVCVHILYIHPVISFGDKKGQFLRRLYGNSHPLIFTTSAQKSHDAVLCPCRFPRIISSAYDFLVQMTILNLAVSSRSS